MQSSEPTPEERARKAVELAACRYGDPELVAALDAYARAMYVRGWRDAMAQDNPPVEAE